MKSVVITGVSTGIGLAAVRAAIGAGYQVFGSVRSEEDAARVRQEFPKHFVPLLFDVTDAEGIARGAEVVRQALGKSTLAGLINNAGIAVSGPLLHVSIEELRKQFEVNVFGVMAVTQAFAGMLGADRWREGEPGKVIQISSIAGRNTSPFVGPYVASKHALEGMSGCLRRELLLHGIDVIVVRPGAIRTPIWDKSKLDVYGQTPYGDALRVAYEYMMGVAAKGLEPERCGALLVRILEARRPKAFYLLVPSLVRDWLVPRLLPERWMDYGVARVLGLKRR